MFDLHTHHDRCGHARGALEDYIEAALHQGLHTIGLSDHAPFFGEPDDHHKPWVAMAKSEFAGYVAEALALRERYRDRINVLVGVESDFFAEHCELYAGVYRRFPLDYVIGSVHVLDGVDLFRPERWDNADDADLRLAKRRYCELVAASARAGRFDILGHIDVIKAACPGIADIGAADEDWMLRQIADADVVVEVNTSGNTKDCGGWYPGPGMLERARFHNVKVTFGSDAHDPERVGDDHENVRDRLRELGFRTWFVFERRRRVGLPL